MSLVFFYPQLKKLTGAERLILKLASYAARRLPEGGVVLLTHRFAPECRPALDARVQVVETGWPMSPTGNHYIDAAAEYALGPALAVKLPRRDIIGVIFFGPPSVPAMAFTRWFLLRLRRSTVPLLYFCFEPPRFIYSDTNDILRRIPVPAPLLRPLLAAYRKLDRLMVGSAHRVLANSPYGARRIRRAYGRSATVIEHGVDFALPDADAALRVRAKYALDERPTVVTVNHLHPRKRIDLFLRSVAHARSTIPSIRALVVGEGPERDNLEQLARELGLQGGERVVFTGAVPEADLPAHFAAAQVYVHTGREESFGLSVIEALRLGLPVVAVDEGGPRDTVASGISGFLVPPTAEALGDAISRLLLQPDKAQAMGQSGAKSVTSRYSWERGAETLLRIVAQVSQSNRENG